MQTCSSVTAIMLAMGAAGVSAGAAHAQNPSSCDQSFWMADADKDGKVTQKEADKATTSQFEKIDANGDGNISSAEYSDCVTSAASGGGSKGRSQNQSASSDSGSNGDVDLEGTASVGSWPSQGRDDAAFNLLDKDKSGGVDRSEYGAGSQKAYDEAKQSGMEEGSEPVMVLRRYIWIPAAGQVGDMSKDEAASRASQGFGALDRNADAELSKEEWKSEADQVSSKQWAQTSFKSMDENSDGMISQAEYQSFRKSGFENAGKDAAKSKQSGASQSDQSAQSDQADGEGVPVIFYHLNRG